MSKSFDEILKEGKDKAKVSVDSLKNWRINVRSLMNILHELNSMYSSNEMHHLKIDSFKCKRCSAASFVLSIRDLNNAKKIIKFHKEKWYTPEKGVYYCDKCKKGR